MAPNRPSFLPLLLIALGLVAIAAAARHAGRSSIQPADPVVSVTQLPVYRPLTAPPAADIPPGLARLAGRGDETVRVFISLDEDPIARLGKSADPGRRLARAAEIRSKQDRVANEIERHGGTLLARMQHLSSGLIASIPTHSATTLAALTGVTGVAEVRDYELHLDETVPQIGATALHDLGFDGSGVVIAIIDSGIDYTHANFGGSGNLADYDDATLGSDPACVTGFEPECAASQPPPPALFPTTKVVGGRDFVGDLWTGDGGPGETQDDNAVDRVGHGSHVADVVAGVNGVAPGASLYALKACSSQTPNCSGVGVLQAMEFALDPDGNPGTRDQVDVINLSLGSPYGQGEDPLVNVANEAVAAGVVVVTSAGNLGDRPFANSTPCIASRVICVGAEHKSSKLAYVLEVGGTVRQQALPDPGAVVLIMEEYYSTSEFEVLSGELQDIGNGCNTLPPGTLSGKIAVVQRGACSYAFKSEIAHAAGATAVIIADTRAQSPDELPDGDFTGLGANPQIPVFTATTVGGLFLVQNDGQTATIDAADAVSVDGWVTGFSSRGPGDNRRLGPNFTAPGAALSAKHGTGTGLSTLSGTSMAAPHIAGTAALLIESNRGIAPEEVLLRLSNTADFGLRAGPPGIDVPAAGSWVGAGSVDVAAANDADISIWWEHPDTEGSLVDRLPYVYYGYRAASGEVADTATVWFYNATDTVRSVTATTHWFNPDDENQGVNVQFLPTGLTVPPFSFQPAPTALVVAQPTMEPPPLEATPAGPSDWDEVDRGANGFNGAAYSAVEYDGTFEIVVDETQQYNLPFNVVVKRTADLNGLVDTTPGPQVAGNVLLANGSSTNHGAYETFVVIDVSENRYGAVVGDCVQSGSPPGCGATPVDLDKVGVGFDMDAPGGPAFELAVTTHEFPQRDSGAVAQFDGRLDTNLDGIYDTSIVNVLLSDGRNGVFTFDFTSGQATFAGFLDSDFYSSAYVLRAPAAQLGLTPGTEFDLLVLAWDGWLDAGFLWDCSPFPPPGEPCGVLNHRMTFDQERFHVPGLRRGVVPTSGTQSIPYEATAESAIASPSHIGVLALYRNAPVLAESQAFVLVQPGIDDDGDGRPNAEDCDPTDPGAFATPGEVPLLIFTDSNTMSWFPVNAASGSGTQYQVFIESGGFGPVGNAPDGTFLDPQFQLTFEGVADPPPGQHLRALVNGVNGCGQGPWGFDRTP